MRFFLGVILGAVLTVGVAYVYDSRATGRVETTGSVAAQSGRQMVNWDVVETNWRALQQRAKDTWSNLSQKVS